MSVGVKKEEGWTVVIEEHVYVPDGRIGDILRGARHECGKQECLFSASILIPWIQDKLPKHKYSR